MKKQLVFWLVSVIFFFFNLKLNGQVEPIYHISNAQKVTCSKVYDFDVVIHVPGGPIYKLARFQFGININPAIIPAGATISVAPVPGSSQLNFCQQPTIDRFSYDAAKNCIIVTPEALPGIDSATNINYSPSGTKFCRVRVTSSLPFNQGISTNHTWSFSMVSGYRTMVWFYIGNTVTDVTNPVDFYSDALGNVSFTTTDPIPQTITSSSTQICQNLGNGAAITISNSQTGFNYQMYKDGMIINETGSVLSGITGSSVTFGHKPTSGIISVKSTGCSGLIDMLNSITLSPITPLNDSITISSVIGTYVEPGNPVTFNANIINGGTSPSFQWYVNGIPDIINGTSNTYSYTPIQGDQVLCKMISSETCKSPEIAISNVLSISMTHTEIFQVTGGGSICQGDTASIVLSGSRGFNYQLLKDGIPYQSSIAATGFPIVWKVVVAGYYTVAIIDPATTMSGSAVVLVNPNYIFQENHNICEGELYQWKGTDYNTTGTYIANYTSIYGCDSIYIMSLSVNPVYTFIENKTICSGTSYAWHGLNHGPPGTYYANYTSRLGCDSTFILNLTVNPVTKSLTIKLFLQSLYANDGLMNHAQGSLGNQFNNGIADQLTVELHNAIMPYSKDYTFNNINLNTNGFLVITDNICNISGSYYLVIKHRNSIETWSSIPLNFNTPGSINYDYSTSVSQAYGNNMKQIGNLNVIWGADVTQDGVVDASDMARIDNASRPPVLHGYYSQDVNGDGVVDGSDMAMIDNNSRPPVVQVKRP